METKSVGSATVETSMKKLTHRVLNFALYILLCLMIGTGLLLEFRLPPRSRGLNVLGLNRHEWGDVHLWIAYGFIALIFLHLFLHRAWLIKVASSSHHWRLWIGLAVGIILIGLFLIFPVA